MGKAKILVVEDETLVALNIKQCLENMGYEVPATVTSGEAALKKAEQKVQILTEIEGQFELQPYEVEEQSDA